MVTTGCGVGVTGDDALCTGEDLLSTGGVAVLDVRDDDDGDDGDVDDDDANALDQNVMNMRFATFMGGGLSTLFPRLLLRKTCCNVVGIRDEKPLGNAEDVSAEVLLPRLFTDGKVTLGGGGGSTTPRLAFRISTA